MIRDSPNTFFKLGHRPCLVDEQMNYSRAASITRKLAESKKERKLAVKNFDNYEFLKETIDQREEKDATRAN